jgi:hypothetical protein
MLDVLDSQECWGDGPPERQEPSLDDTSARTIPGLDLAERPELATLELELQVGERGQGLALIRLSFLKALLVCEGIARGLRAGRDSCAVGWA